MARKNKIEQPAPSRSWDASLWAPLAGAAVIVISICLAYSNSLEGEFFFDDNDSIGGNPSIRPLFDALNPPPAMPSEPYAKAAWEIQRARTRPAADPNREPDPIQPTLAQGILSALSPPRDLTVTGRPMLNLSLAVNYAIGQENVRSYHIFNILTHVLAALAMFGVVRRTLLLPSLRAYFEGKATPAALATALLWALHPLQTESVTYVIQRAEAMVSLMYLLTLYCAVRGFAASNAAQPRAARIWYILCVASCAVGMATKEVMISAPLFVLLYDGLLVSPNFKNALGRRTGLYAGLAASWAVLAMVMIQAGDRGGTAGFGAADTCTPWQYARTQFGVILHYLRLTFWPDSLCIDYYWPVAKNPMDMIPGAVMLAVLLGLAAWGLFTRRKWAAAGALFFLALGPSSSIVPIRDLAFEHRMYLPLAAIMVLLVAGAVCAWNKLMARKNLPQSAWLIPLGLCLAATVSLAVQTSIRNEDYRTRFGLWKDTVKKRPGNARAHANLGVLMAGVGDMKESYRLLTRSMELDPNFTPAYSNRAMLLYRAGRYDQAIEDCTKAIAITSKYAPACYNRGLARNARGDRMGALEDFTKAIELCPTYCEAFADRGNVYVALGRMDLAIADYSMAIKSNPAYLLGWYNRAATYTEMGQFDKAWFDLNVYRLNGGGDYAELYNRLAQRSGRTQ